MLRKSGNCNRQCSEECSLACNLFSLADQVEKGRLCIKWYNVCANKCSIHISNNNALDLTLELNHKYLVFSQTVWHSTVQFSIINIDTVLDESHSTRLLRLVAWVGGNSGRKSVYIKQSSTVSLIMKQVTDGFYWQTSSLCLIHEPVPSNSYIIPHIMTSHST